MTKQQPKELVFIPLPFMGHLLPTIELAHRLITRDPSDQITATILIIKFPDPNEKIDTYIESLKKSSKTNRVSILELPPLTTPPDLTSGSFMSLYFDAYRPVVKQALLDRFHHQHQPASGIVLDMFCTTMIEVADDLGIPSYIFFTIGASTVSFFLHFEGLDDATLASFGGGTPENTVLEVAGFEKPIPKKVWPAEFSDKDGISKSHMMLNHARRFRRVKGFMVNTFTELQPAIIRALSTEPGKGDHIPSIYPVGPILNLKDEQDSSSDVLRWLDSQPQSSVVFLCFGSMGSFDEDQVKEIAVGLERSGQRFLWSLRCPPHEKGADKTPVPGDYDDYNEVLPEGFLNRTAEFGRVIGWAPQVAVLAHKAVGAFVSHCGWNSTLESLWFGVPMLTWPMYAEQQLNAFLLVTELGLAVEIRMDYKRHPREGGANMIVKAEEVEKAVRKMMEGEEGVKVRQKVKEMSVAARRAVSEDGVGGSSWQSMGKFIEDVLENQVTHTQ